VGEVYERFGVVGTEPELDLDSSQFVIVADLGDLGDDEHLLAAFDILTSKDLADEVLLFAVFKRKIVTDVEFDRMAVVEELYELRLDVFFDECSEVNVG
jgi:hypothetical protein